MSIVLKYVHIIGTFTVYATVFINLNQTIHLGIINSNNNLLEFRKKGGNIYIYIYNPAPKNI